MTPWFYLIPTLKGNHCLGINLIFVAHEYKFNICNSWISQQTLERVSHRSDSKMRARHWLSCLTDGEIILPSYPVCWTSSWHAQHSFLHFAAKIKLVFVIVMRPSWAERSGMWWVCLCNHCAYMRSECFSYKCLRRGHLGDCETQRQRMRHHQTVPPPVCTGLHARHGNRFVEVRFVPEYSLSIVCDWNVPNWNFRVFLSLCELYSTFPRITIISS